MGRDTVDLVPYSEAWPAEFRRERARLEPVFGTSATAIEHIGSTAVPGLMAKPTIDIAVGMRDIGALPGKVGELEELGYEFRPDAAFHDEHRFLRRIVGDERTHHLHVVQVPHRDWDEWIAFRDRLRADPAAAGAYQLEKQRLAERFRAERGRYVEAKTSVIRRLLAEAGAPRRPPRSGLEEAQHGQDPSVV